MTRLQHPFSDSAGSPPEPSALPDPELLLELAAWTDGTLPPERLAALEARLADDPSARALAASVRLRPVTPADAAAPVPAALIGRASQLVPGDGLRNEAPSPVVETVRGPFRLAPILRSAAAVAACLAAAAVGWRFGASAARPVAANTTAVASTVDDGPASPETLLAAASFGVFDDVDDDPLEFLVLIDPATTDGGLTQ